MMIQPQTRIDFYQPSSTTPQEPQNLLRPTNKGCGTCTAMAGLGALKGPGLRGIADGGVPAIWGVISAVSSGVSAYHGYKRNKSIGWAIAWGLMGGIFPIIVPTIAFAQGLGKRKGR